jgi:hypothetical protein
MNVHLVKGNPAPLLQDSVWPAELCSHHGGCHQCLVIFWLDIFKLHDFWLFFCPDFRWAIANTTAGAFFSARRWIRADESARELIGEMIFSAF